MIRKFPAGDRISLQCDLIHDKVWRRALFQALLRTCNILQTSEAQLLSQLYVLSFIVHAGPDPCLDGPQGILCEDSAHNWFQGTLLSSFLGAASLLTVAPGGHSRGDLLRCSKVIVVLRLIHVSHPVPLQTPGMKHELERGRGKMSSGGRLEKMTSTWAGDWIWKRKVCQSFPGLTNAERPPEHVCLSQPASMPDWGRNTAGNP